MSKLKWRNTKPKRWKECILITATWMNYHEPYYWDYKIFTVKQADGEDEHGNPGWYWGIFLDDDEWGDIADLKADKYCMIQPLNKPK